LSGCSGSIRRMQIHALTAPFRFQALPARASSQEPADTFTPSEDLERLRKLDFRMGLQTMTYFEAEFTPEPDIPKMRRAVGTDRAPGGYGSQWAGLAHSGPVRERANLPAGNRFREPVEQDRAWGKLCADALQGWADKGQLRIQHKGKPLPKDADLLK